MFYTTSIIFVFYELSIKISSYYACRTRRKKLVLEFLKKDISERIIEKNIWNTYACRWMDGKIGIII